MSCHIHGLDYEWGCTFCREGLIRGRIRHEHVLFLVTGGGETVDTPNPKAAHDMLTARGIKTHGTKEVCAVWACDVLTGKVSVVVVMSDGVVKLDLLTKVLPGTLLPPG